jgi:hypothetical protein
LVVEAVAPADVPVPVPKTSVLCNTVVPAPGCRPAAHSLAAVACHHRMVYYRAYRPMAARPVVYYKACRPTVCHRMARRCQVDHRTACCRADPHRAAATRCHRHVVWPDTVDRTVLRPADGRYTACRLLVCRYTVRRRVACHCTVWRHRVPACHPAAVRLAAAAVYRNRRGGAHRCAALARWTDAGAVRRMAAAGGESPAAAPEGCFPGARRVGVRRSRLKAPVLPPIYPRIGYGALRPLSAPATYPVPVRSDGPDRHANGQA